MGYDPTREASMEMLKALPAAGADIIELGISFSDPMADGITIQQAAMRAFEAGASLKGVLAMVQEFRQVNITTPLILMGYYNPIYRYGIAAFVQDAVFAGADGVIIVDLPPEEEEEFTEIAAPAGLALIKLTSPTTDAARAKVVLKHASGFVYYISVAGVTGTKSSATSDVAKQVAVLKQVTDLPIAVGFGISTPEHAKSLAPVAEGVVVGSAIVKLVGAGKQEEALQLVRDIKAAIA
jgi:tryptophan synthase alpha chain